jgi:hypothetical protein
MTRSKHGTWQNFKKCFELKTWLGKNYASDREQQRCFQEGKEDGEPLLKE